jgi:hypothetical protein
MQKKHTIKRANTPTASVPLSLKLILRHAMAPGGEPVSSISIPVYAHQQENGIQASAEAEL